MFGKLPSSCRNHGNNEYTLSKIKSKKLHLNKPVSSHITLRLQLNV